jgi:hypothetical protein
VEEYRRSMIPFYLLSYEAIIYPRYVDNSEISKNLCGMHTINVKVYFDKTIQERIDCLKIEMNSLTIEDVSLLSSATKLMKKIRKDLYLKIKQKESTVRTDKN